MSAKQIYIQVVKSVIEGFNERGYNVTSNEKIELCKAATKSTFSSVRDEWEIDKLETDLANQFTLRIRVKQPKQWEWVYRE